MWSAWEHCSRTTRRYGFHMSEQTNWILELSCGPTGQFARPACQKEHVGFGEGMLAIGPGDLLDHNAAGWAVRCADAGRCCAPTSARPRMSTVAVSASPSSRMSSRRMPDSPAQLRRRSLRSTSPTSLDLRSPANGREAVELLR